MNTNSYNTRDINIQLQESVGAVYGKISKFGSSFFKMITDPTASISGGGDVKTFDGQVAGHGGILQLPNGSLIKGSTDVELNFYKAVKDCNLPLKKFMPDCYNFDPEFKQIEEQYLAGKDGCFINMQNLLSNYHNPNVIDIKLGTKLYDDNADEMKKQKMIAMANNTTSAATGIQISALQIFDKPEQRIKKIGKTYGKMLTVDNLPHALLRFFYNITEPVYKNSIYSNEEELDKTFLNREPSNYTVGFFKAILAQIYELRDAVYNSHTRIVGSSLCIIYETIEVAREVERRCQNPNEYVYPFSVRLIDFAHSTFVDPSLGEDQSFMTGLNNIIVIIENYLKTFNKI
jgi:hypothetical protein